MKMKGIVVLALSVLAAGCASMGKPAPSGEEPSVSRKYDEAVLETAAFLKSPASAIEDNFGEPWRMVNVGGIGFYGYERYGFYFDDIVFYYENGFKIPVEGDRARVLAIDCLDDKGFQGIVRGSSRVADLVAALGRPDEIRKVAAGGEIANPFAGRYHLYAVDEGFLAFREEGGLVASILLVDGGTPFFK